MLKETEIVVKYALDEPTAVSGAHGSKEMTNPGLLYLHAISLVTSRQQAAAPCTSRSTAGSTLAPVPSHLPKALPKGSALPSHLASQALLSRRAGGPQPRRLDPRRWSAALMNPFQTPPQPHKAVCTNETHRLSLERQREHTRQASA